MHILDILSVFQVIPMIFVIIAAVYVLATSARILREYERAVIFRLGRVAKAIINIGGEGNGPGLIILIPLLEIYQQKDGSVKIPEVLQKYMGEMKEIK